MAILKNSPYVWEDLGKKDHSQWECGETASGYFRLVFYCISLAFLKTDQKQKKNE